MVYALGIPESSAALLLLVIGPFLGVLTARFPLRRSNLVLGVVTCMAIAWTALLAWPGVPPLWLLIVLGIGGAD